MLLRRFFVLWFVGSLLFTLLVYLTTPGEGHWVGYYVWFVVGGLLFLLLKNRVRTAWSRWSVTLLLIVLQAVVASWARGESFLQYLAHDLLIFFPWLLSLSVLAARSDLTRVELLVVVALHGGIMEGVVLSPLGLFILPLTAVFYWLMVFPVVLVRPCAVEVGVSPRRHLVPLVLPLLVALLAQLVAVVLSRYLPWLFSPYDF